MAGMAPARPARRRSAAARDANAPRWERSDYTALLTLRTELRRFLQWSAQQARSVELTPAIHQLLLAVAGHPDPAGATITDVAGYLLRRHHSVVALVDRAEEAGLLTRVPDGRFVRLRLTPDGEARLAALTSRHQAELRQLSVMFADMAARSPEDR